jgi:hypothetical protein
VNGFPGAAQHEVVRKRLGVGGSEIRGATASWETFLNFAELVIGPATSGGTRWLHPGYG